MDLQLQRLGSAERFTKTLGRELDSHSEDPETPPLVSHPPIIGDVAALGNLGML